MWEVEAVWSGGELGLGFVVALVVFSLPLAVNSSSVIDPYCFKPRISGNLSRQP